MAKKQESRWIKANGEVTDVFPKGKTWSLKELQEKVGGYIEIIRNTNLPAEYVMLANEEGYSMNLPLNKKASGVAAQIIVGNALIIPAKQMK